MPEFSEGALTGAVVKRISGAKNKRLRLVMAATVRHLHALIREVGLTEAEWMKTIRFLTATGQKCDDRRQEFILLSDTLGVSMLVDAINHRKSGKATQSTVLGPFWVPGAPLVENGADIARRARGQRTVIEGRVLDAKRRPVEGAVVDVWHSAPDGTYDVQRKNWSMAEADLRARFKSDARGRFWFKTLMPASYPVPTDGPVGELLEACKRHPMRPAHVHFKIDAKGSAPLTTHLFARGDKYIDSDTVFGVKDSLIVDFARKTSAADAKRFGVKAPFRYCSYDFILEKARRS